MAKSFEWHIQNNGTQVLIANYEWGETAMTKQLAKAGWIAVQMSWGSDKDEIKYMHPTEAPYVPLSKSELERRCGIIDRLSRIKRARI